MSADTPATLFAPLLEAAHGGALLREKLAEALAGQADLCLTTAERGAGALLVERVSGAAGTWRVHAVAGDAEPLLASALQEPPMDGARLVTAELPDDSTWAAVAAALRAAGFSEAGRVPDFYADGVALVIYARDGQAPDARRPPSREGGRR